MKKLIYILLLGFVLRIMVVLYFGNLKQDFYWEYGEIAKNIIHGNGYSLFYIDNSKLEYHYNPGMKPSVSAYMSPGYVFFLYPFILIKNIFLRNVTIYSFQILISLITIALIFKLTKMLFPEKVALLASFIVAVTPEFIYANLSYTPTIIYHLLIVLLFVVSLIEFRKENNLLYFGIITSLIIYFRSEFVLFWLLCIISLFMEKKYQSSLKIFILVLILIIPWGIRNYLLFNKIIPLTTGFGLNLYRGNNSEAIGDWGDEEISGKISNLNNDNLEISLNNIYQEKAISFIKGHPMKVIKNAGIKLFYFLFYNPHDRRTSSILYILPVLLILLFSIVGIILTFNWSDYKYIYLFFLYSIISIMIFFPLPRYQTMMKIMLIPFCAYGICKFYNWCCELINSKSVK